MSFSSRRISTEFYLFTKFKHCLKTQESQRYFWLKQGWFKSTIAAHSKMIQNTLTMHRNTRGRLYSEKGVSLYHLFLKVLDGKGAESIRPQDWKAYSRAIGMWASMESPGYSDLVEMLYENPNTTVDKDLLKMFSKDEIDLDKILETSHLLDLSYVDKEVHDIERRLRANKRTHQWFKTFGVHWAQS